MQSQAHGWQSRMVSASHAKWFSSGHQARASAKQDEMLPRRPPGLVSLMINMPAVRLLWMGWCRPSRGKDTKRSWAGTTRAGLSTVKLLGSGFSLASLPSPTTAQDRGKHCSRNSWEVVYLSQLPSRFSMTSAQESCISGS